ncbi:3'-5'-exoribonuclease [Sorochytrium milnesiophthora]
MDRKRITGPEVSVPPLPMPEELDAEQQVPLVDDDGLRADARNREAIRPLFLKTGSVWQANGSALIEVANTKVICAVYGPRPDRRNLDQDKGTVAVDLRFATFASVKRRGFIPSDDEKAHSAAVLTALLPSIRLDSFPKSTVDIFITVFEEDGVSSVLAAAVTCASLALADAGIELYDFVVGAAAGFAQKQIVMDCTAREEDQLKGSLLLSYMPSLNEITQFAHTGHVDDDTMAEALRDSLAVENGAEQ